MCCWSPYPCHGNARDCRDDGCHAAARYDDYKSVEEAMSGEIVPPLLAKVNQHFERLAELRVELRQAARESERLQREARAREMAFNNRGKAQARANARCKADSEAAGKMYRSWLSSSPYVK